MKHAPARIRAPLTRRQELRTLLMTLAERTTKAKTLSALAKAVHRSQEAVSIWIRQGEVPAAAAGELLRLKKANPEGALRIYLKDLTPSLF